MRAAVKIVAVTIKQHGKRYEHVCSVGPSANRSTVFNHD